MPSCSSRCNLPFILGLCWLKVVCSTLIYGVFLVKNVDGQRIKEGCYDAKPISCQDEKTPLEEIDFDVENVCGRILFDLGIGWDDVVLADLTRHVAFLNSVEANTEFCDRIRIAYPHCAWCASDDEISFLECIALATYPRCGDQPTLEEVLADDVKYSQFETQADVNATCNELKGIELDVGNFWYPSSVDICEKMKLVNHLCPGTCDGTCFSQPPSCEQQMDLNSTEGLPFQLAASNPFTDVIAFDIIINADLICEELRRRLFYHVEDIDVVMNITHHEDYLRLIQETDPQCESYRQIYPSCVWCNKDLCFDDKHPLSCETTETEDMLESLDDATVIEQLDSINSFCYLISTSLYSVEDIFDTSSLAEKSLMLAHSPFCEPARLSASHCFWCVPDNANPDFCDGDQQFCDNDDVDVPIPDDFVSITVPGWRGFVVDGRLNPAPETLDCAEAYVNWSNFTSFPPPTTYQTCYETYLLARLCPGDWCLRFEAPGLDQEDYLGTTSSAERKSLVWVSRASAMLSFFGASCILFAIIKNPTTRSTVYHQLLIGMAVFDIITAFAWVFATAPIDSDKSYYVEGAIGNDSTCKAQAFFIQLGFTSVFYNVSLSLYYVLVIVYSWREFQLRKIRPYMHAVPVFIGVGLAFGGIPIYAGMEYACHITPLKPPATKDLWVELFFVVLPLGLSIIAITTSMLFVFYKVRRQAASTRKWTFGLGRASKMERAVFFQCLFYVFAFYITWPILFSVYLASIDVNGPFELTMLVAFVAPLQGFSNYLVFMRPKMIDYYTYLRKKRKPPTGAAQAKKTFRASSRDPIASMGPSAVIAFQSEASSLRPENTHEDLPHLSHLPVVDESTTADASNLKASAERADPKFSGSCTDGLNNQETGVSPLRECSVLPTDGVTFVDADLSNELEAKPSTDGHDLEKDTNTAHLSRRSSNADVESVAEFENGALSGSTIDRYCMSPRKARRSTKGSR